ncbi:hypothetical protein HYY70_00300 [Candidatus Woesearchaeota archaeon]|nr:hypothetical protein [Candidatus Woesearchaeota archaeon]
MTLETTGGEPLERRLASSVTSQIAVISAGIEVLLNDKRYRNELNSSTYEALAQYLGKMGDATTALAKLLKVSSPSVAHDANNSLAVILGRAQLLSRNGDYNSQLSPETYAHFTVTLTAIENAVQALREPLQILGGFYKIAEQDVEVAEASKLGLEEIVYRIVHVDDNELTRELVKDTLKKGSNVVDAVIPGVFGHDGKRIRYEIYSYGSVLEALNEIPKLAEIDLVITDREMPMHTGVQFLYAISQLPNTRVRMPDYEKVRRIAMLTSGISQEEADFVANTYGATIIDKSIKPLALEQQIYRIINSQLSQS